jgi:hypothetical protein
MITRNRIKSSEKQAALIWQQAVGAELTSTQDELLNVIYPGRINGDNGPDFRDAVILNKLRLTKGDVEVHVRSSDWYSHEHHTNAAYNNVILHVAMWHDCNSATLLQNGKPVPLLCLAKALRHQPYLLPYTLSCFQILDQMDWQTLGKLLNAAGEERFKEKAMHFQAEILGPVLKAPSAVEAAGQVLYRGMMRALGYAKNTRPFEDLADRMPLTAIEFREGLSLKQAMLLGTAGLLPSQRRQGKFGKGKEVQELEQTWQSADKKAEAMKEGDWNLSRIYPNNSPVRRIIAQSYLIERYSDRGLLAGILQLVKDTPLSGRHSALQNSLTVDGDGYWRDHFDFDVRSKTKISALLGNSKAGEIAVNVILPFAFSWGELSDQAMLTENAIGLYRNYPRLAENCITRHMAKQLCLKDSLDFTASHQQGLIHIFRNYCREGRCSECLLASCGVLTRKLRNRQPSRQPQALRPRRSGQSLPRKPRPTQEYH